MIEQNAIPPHGLQGAEDAAAYGAEDYSRRPPISDALNAVSDAEDLDKAVIFAGIINLQIESIRRFRKRELLQTEDIRTFGAIYRLLVPDRAMERGIKELIGRNIEGRPQRRS